LPTTNPNPDPLAPLPSTPEAAARPPAVPGEFITNSLETAAHVYARRFERCSGEWIHNFPLKRVELHGTETWFVFYDLCRCRDRGPCRCLRAARVTEAPSGRSDTSCSYARQYLRREEKKIWQKAFQRTLWEPF